jgi:NAD(P) transhydrogenase
MPMAPLSDHDGAAYDLVVIGLGPAGEKGAAQAAYFGKRVAGIEAQAVGGAVVNTGTLPSKTLRETALYLSGLRSRHLYGIDYTFSRSVGADDLFYRKNIVERAHLDLVHENLARHGIDVLAGRGELVDAHTVLVRGPDGDEARVYGEHILIATGSRPARPAEIPFDGERVFDSDSILELRRIPRSLIVAGAGVIGCEYATLFAALGAEVMLVDAREDLLPFLDHEIAGILRARMESVGVRLAFGDALASIRVDRADGAGVAAGLGGGRVLRAEAALYALGRRANTDGIGLERLGVELNRRGQVTVDECFRTAVPSVLAAGDVIGFPALASTSMEQARVAVCQAFGFAYKREVSSLIPLALYTIPEVSMAGETEEALGAAGVPYLAGRAHYRQNARAQILGDTGGLIKILCEPDELRLLGVHIIGERAAELVHVGQMCMRFGGTAHAFIDTVFNFPTIADAYKYAAYEVLQARERWRSGED